MSTFLHLSPLPSTRNHDTSDSLLMEREGFVDEAAVLAMVSQPLHSRRVPCPDDLVLTLDDMDFAGWQSTPQPPRHRTPEVPPQVINAIMGRPTPPLSRPVRPSEPASNNIQWWLACLAGSLTALLVAVIFIAFSPGPRRTLENFLANATASLAPAEAVSAPQPEETPEP
jgi:hypothetical protein